MTLQKVYGKMLKELRRDVELNSMARISRRIGVPYMTLSDICRDYENPKGTMKTWLKIDRYYGGRR